MSTTVCTQICNVLTIPWQVYSNQEPTHYTAHTTEHKNQPARFHLAFSPQQEIEMFLVLTEPRRASVYSKTKKRI